MIKIAYILHGIDNKGNPILVKENFTKKKQTTNKDKRKIVKLSRRKNRK